MIEPRVPDDEVDRLRTLQALQILDTLPVERFDRYTRLARRLFDLPIALVSLVDEHRQWFKSHDGLDASETPRSISFCGHAIHNDEVFCVPNALEDIRFADNPLVTGEPGIRFYAGYPLRMRSGHRIGTLCVIGREPRQFGDDECEMLADLGRMVVDDMATLTLATIDELTGLSNRRGFVEITRPALAACERSEQACSLVYIDLNDFKRINDRFGHAAGDQALVDFSALLLKAFRASDVVGRMGGDEFAVLASGSSASTLITGALGRLSATVDDFNENGGRKYELQYSIGCEDFTPDSHAGVDALLAGADERMYADKQRTKIAAIKARALLA